MRKSTRLLPEGGVIEVVPAANVYTHLPFTNATETVVVSLTDVWHAPVPMVPPPALETWEAMRVNRGTAMTVHTINIARRRRLRPC